MNNLFKMSRADLLAVPYITDGVFDSVVIVPLPGKHDSGYRLMEYVGISGGKCVGKFSGECSDALELSGDGWQLECLPKSNCILVWNRRYNIAVYDGIRISHFTLERGEKRA